VTQGIEDKVVVVTGASSGRGEAAAPYPPLVMSAHGYDPPVEPNEGPSAMRSRTGRFEAGETGGWPVRQEQAQRILVAALGILRLITQ
jgi:hypothetical protein